MNIKSFNKFELKLKTTIVNDDVEERERGREWCKQNKKPMARFNTVYFLLPQSQCNFVQKQQKEMCYRYVLRVMTGWNGFICQL